MVSKKHFTTQDLPKVEETESTQDNPEQLATLKLRKNVTLSRMKRKVLKHVFILRFLILCSIVLAIGFLGFYSLQRLKTTEFGAYSGLAWDFLTTPEEKINSFEDRTNILILGKGGQGHEAPDLTDSMMVASVSFKDPDIKLISLPRDIWIPELRAKLNSIYYWGNKKEEGGGLVLAKSSVEEVVGLPIHYGVVVDFSGFKRIIDAIGGVDVTVENTFTDNKYPIPGRENDLCGGDREYKCRYETVYFEKGMLHMDGEVALKFARSRNAEGDEGTDLARAARQEKILEAIKNKILTREILLSPGKIRGLKDAILSSIETDLTDSESAILARRFYAGKNNLSSAVIPEVYLEVPKYSPLYDNLYVFIPKEIDSLDPKKRSWVKVHEWVKCLLANGSCN